MALGFLFALALNRQLISRIKLISIKSECRLEEPEGFPVWAL
jgi:hypothetical protein